MRAAVIPARGGSKRIPRKNIRSFAGKPMISYAIGCALESGLFDRVLVSTDDAEVAAVSRDCGAVVPFVRPAHLADDYTGTTAVIAHAVDWLMASGVELSAVCCIYATAPFIRQGDLRAALTLLEAVAWEYVFPATSYPAPIFRSFEKVGRGGLQMFFPEHFQSRSQDLPKALHDAAQFYWGRPGAWLREAQIFEQHSTVIEIPNWRVQDIDTEDDWRRAESLAGQFTINAQRDNLSES